MSTLHRALPGLRQRLAFAAGLFGSLLVAGWFFVDFVGRTGQALETERLQALVRTAAATLEADRIEALRGQPEDGASASFGAVRAELRRVRDVNPDFRFVYLMRERDGAMIFLADSEEPESEDYSAPGDVYDGPSEALLRVHATGHPEVMPPYEDRWGKWVTAIAPVRAEDGRIIAVLGMDVRADAWQATLRGYRAFATVISTLALLLLAAFLAFLELQHRAAVRLSEANRQLAGKIDELERAQADLELADVVVRHTGEGILVLDGELRVRRANPGFERITGYRAASCLGELPPPLAHDPEAFGHLRTRLQSGTHWDGTLWAYRADGERFPIEVSLDAVRDPAGGIAHHVLVFRDVTVQKQLEDRLRELSATDALTLLANRRSFDEALEREWHRATRTGEPVSLIMCDIDHFKPYNDRYGHVGGDRCLQQVASALASGVSHPGALVARYGGEEFAVILPRTDAARAREIAEALRRRVEALKLPHEGSPESDRVTISVGISTRTPPQATDFEDLMQSADAALYRAKASGRNLVAGPDT